MSTNVAVVSGRLTRDVEMKVVGDYDLAQFSIAFDVGWGNRRHTVFIDCKFWGKGARSVSTYLLKGKAVTVTGYWDCERWTGNDGQERSKFLIVVNSLELGGGGKAERDIDPPDYTF